MFLYEASMLCFAYARCDAQLLLYSTFCSTTLPRLLTQGITVQVQLPLLHLCLFIPAILNSKLLVILRSLRLYKLVCY